MVRRKKHDLFLHALSLVLLTISMSSFAENDTLRHPAAGPISGAVNENGTLAWLGIPYAQAPIGNLRWKAPRALTPFDQVFTATTFADMCTQLGNPLLDIDPSLYGKAVGSEDCLYLNVWTPFMEAYHYESKSRGYEDTPEKKARFEKSKNSDARMRTIAAFNNKAAH